MAAVLAGTSFGASGGLRVESTTVVEILLTLAGALVAAVALVRAPAARLWGAAPLALFGGLAAVTTLSIVWSIQPADSWLEASRTFAYLSLFAGTLGLAALARARAESIVAGVALAGVVVCGYALLTKVFPAALNPDETYARLREPFGYWNAVGLVAALGVPPLLWLGARRSGHAAWNALAYPALGLLLVTVFLAYSRGSLLAIALGLAFWFAVVPLRLRGLTVLAASALAAAPVIAWAFGQDALSKNAAVLPARVTAGHHLGVLLVLMTALLLAAGLAIGFAVARRAPSPRLRRRVGTAAVTALALAPFVLVVVLALSARGVGGSVSHAWRSLTSEKAITPANTPERLTATASVRARYWREAVHIWRDHPVLGAGAGGFATARPRYRKDTLEVRHAHGYVVQTLADLGIVGMAISLLLTGAWLATALRATGLRRRDRGLPFTPERIALLTLFAGALIFGFHSLVDWTWFVPGTAAIGLLCAAWLAGRGPLRDAGGEPWRAGTLVRRVAAGAVVAIALGAAWATWQPLRSVHASNDALAYLYTDGRADAARQTAQIAHDRNPLSVDPYFDLSAIEIAGGRPQAAGRALERAVALQPSNPQTWSRLADYELTRLHDPRRALQAARVAIFLDPRSLDNLSNFLVARRQVTVLEQQAQQARQARHAQHARQARRKARKKKHR